MSFDSIGLSELALIKNQSIHEYGRKPAFMASSLKLDHAIDPWMHFAHRLRTSFGQMPYLRGERFNFQVHCRHSTHTENLLA